MRTKHLEGLYDDVTEPKITLVPAWQYLVKNIITKETASSNVFFTCLEAAAEYYKPAKHIIVLHCLEYTKTMIDKPIPVIFYSSWYI